MADVTVVAANVRPIGDYKSRRFTAGVSMTPGQPVYISGNDTVALADGSAVSTGAATIGIVVAGAAGGATIAAGEEVDVVTEGPVTGFTTNMVAGTVFYVSDSVGVICDAAGGATKDVVIGIGLNASTLYVRPQVVEFS